LKTARRVTSAPEDRDLVSDAPTVVYIASAGHSGSTLLDLVLGNHPSAVSLGEVYHLPEDRSGEQCACGAEVMACEFWTEVMRRLARSTGRELQDWSDFPFAVINTKPQFRRMPSLTELSLVTGSRHLLSLLTAMSSEARDHVAAAVNSSVLFRTVASMLGATHVIDSSKGASRMKAMFLTDRERLRVIHLVRDGRAFVASARRHHGGTIEHHVRIWLRRNRNARRMLLTMPRGSVRLLRYEDLCAAPSRTISDLCSFVGLSYGPEMLHLGNRIAHMVGGSDVRFNNVEEITLDQRWKRELSVSDLRAFDSAVGSYNRKWGYD
jgi:hypothetical protein